MTIAEKRQQLQILRIVLSVSALLCIGVAAFLYVTKPDIANLPIIAGVVFGIGLLDLIIANIIITKKIQQLDQENDE